MIRFLPRHSFIRFSLIGAATSAIYIFLTWLGDSILRLTYPATITIAYTLSTLFHFHSNRRLAFGDSASHGASQKYKYVAMLLANYMLQLLFSAAGIEYLGLSIYVTTLTCTSVMILINYLLSRYWIFKA